MKNGKTELWKMRADKNDKEDIARLAKRLRMKQAQAVRFAVAHMLETTEPRPVQSPIMQATA